MADVEIGVVEGVMGMFDGGPSSSAALAAQLDIPLILVLDVRSAAESAAAVLKGFETFDPTVRPKGVILNMVGSNRHLELVGEAIEKNCCTEILGHLPRTLDFTIPSRHLGLHMGEETPVTTEKIGRLAESVIDHIDMDRLLEITALDSLPAEAQQPAAAQKRIRLGVARDRAFCFYYEDNLDLLRQAGAEICYFSPLEDAHLPHSLDAVYLGGGYPELYGAQLSGNRSLLKEIRQWAEDGGPLYAECGGFMYLSRGITDLEGHFHPLAGIFPTRAVMQSRRASLGYREIRTAAPTFFGPAETVLRGHEFHYSHIEPMESSIERAYIVNNGTTEGYRYHNVIGGYMHLHFGSNQRAVHNFIQFCKD
jgi:cobyrinic acid a,c-diamide synthase